MYWQQNNNKILLTWTHVYYVHNSYLVFIFDFFFFDFDFLIFFWFFFWFFFLKFETLMQVLSLGVYWISFYPVTYVALLSLAGLFFDVFIFIYHTLLHVLSLCGFISYFLSMFRKSRCGGNFCVNFPFKGGWGCRASTILVTWKCYHGLPLFVAIATILFEYVWLLSYRAMSLWHTSRVHYLSGMHTQCFSSFMMRMPSLSTLLFLSACVRWSARVNVPRATHDWWQDRGSVGCDDWSWLIGNGERDVWYYYLYRTNMM